jgi:hypothetical protein
MSQPPIIEAMGRKRVKLRTITINGVPFHWIADWSYAEGVRIVRLRVWGGDKTRQTLHAHLVATFHGLREAVARGDGRLPTTIVDTSYIAPREVRTLIEYGLAHGWDPQASGKPFCLTEADPSPSGELVLKDIP